MNREGNEAPQAGAKGVASSRERADSTGTSASGGASSAAGAAPSPSLPVFRRNRRGQLAVPGDTSSSDDGSRSSERGHGAPISRQRSAGSGGSKSQSNPSRASSKSSAAAFCETLRKVPATCHLDDMEAFLDQRGGAAAAAAPKRHRVPEDATPAEVPPAVDRWAGSADLLVTPRSSRPVTRSSSTATIVAGPLCPAATDAAGPAMSPVPELTPVEDADRSDCRSTAPEASVSGEASRSLPSDPSGPSHLGSHGKHSIHSAATTSSVGSAISGFVDGMKSRPRTRDRDSMKDFLAHPPDAAGPVDSESDTAASDAWDWSMLTQEDEVDLRGLCLSPLQLQIWLNLSAIYGFGLYTDAFPSGLYVNVLVSNEALRAVHGGCYDGLALMQSASASSTCRFFKIDYPHIPAEALQQLHRDVRRSRCPIQTFALTGEQVWGKPHWQAFIRLLGQVKDSIERIKLPHIGGLEDAMYAFGDFNYDLSFTLLSCPMLYTVDWFQTHIQSDGLLYLFMSLVMSLDERLRLPGLSDEDIEAFNERAPFFGEANQEVLTDKQALEAYQARLVADLNVFMGNDAHRIDVTPPPSMNNQDWARFFKTLGTFVLNSEGMPDKRINLCLGEGFDSHHLNRLTALLLANAPVVSLNLCDSKIHLKSSLVRFARALQNNQHLARLVLPKGINWRDKKLCKKLCQGIRDGSALRELHVPSCQMSQAALEQLIKAVIENGGIRQLVLSDVTFVKGSNLYDLRAYVKAQVESACEQASLLNRVRLNDEDFRSKPDKTGLCGLVSQLPATCRVPASLVHRHNETIDDASRRKPNEVCLFGKRWQFSPLLGHVIATAPPLRDEVDLAFYQNHLPLIQSMLQGMRDAMSKIFHIEYAEDIFANENAQIAAAHGDASLYKYYKLCIADGMRSFADRVNEQYRAHLHVPICDLDQASIERYVDRALSWWFAFDKGSSKPKPLLVMLMAMFVQTAADCDLEVVKDYKNRDVLASSGYFYGQGGQLVASSLTPRQKALIDIVTNRVWLRPEVIYRQRRNQMLLRIGLVIVASAIVFAIVFATLPHVSLGLPFLIGMTLLQQTATCWGMLMGAFTLMALYERGLSWAHRMDARREAMRAAKANQVNEVTMQAEGATRQCVQQFFGAKPRPVSESPQSPIHGRRARHLFFERPTPLERDDPHPPAICMESTL